MQRTPEFFMPKNHADLSSCEIGYAYPSSPRAEYFDAGKTGCYFLQFNGGNAHTGPFKTLADAEQFKEKHYAAIRYGYYSMRADKSMEEYRKAFQH